MTLLMPSQSLRILVLVIVTAFLLQAAKSLHKVLRFDSQVMSFEKLAKTENTSYSEEAATALEPHEAEDSPEIIALCPETPPNLGPITTQSMMELQDSDVLVELEAGGAYRPTACRARQSVALIIPDILKETKGVTMTSLYVIHNLLMKQQLDYRIFVVQPANKSNLFISRGLLMNIGFRVAQQKRQDWQCFVFHSPSIIPTDTRNLYRCAPEHVRQLVSSITDFSYVYVNKRIRAVNRKRLFGKVQKVPFGHVIAMTKKHFANVNGFSNGFWPNDGEFGDMRLRLKYANVDVKRSPAAINRYVRLNNTKFSIKETPSIAYKREKMAVTLKPRPDEPDGISTIPFHAQTQDILYLYTSIEVDTTADDIAVPTPRNDLFEAPNFMRVS